MSTAASVYAAPAASLLHAYSHKLYVHLHLLYSVLATLVATCTSIATSLLDEYPWLRVLRNAVCHFCAFLVGSTLEDERVAFSKRMLVKNDSYRDRLLEPEIADLVDLSEALRLSIAQRKALFQCFLHLDFMRRAGVTRTELLRYCDLRATPLTLFLLPEAEDGATHRSGMTRRWDILQWLAVCFSVCTLELDLVRELGVWNNDSVDLIQISIAEACRVEMAEDLPPEPQNETPIDLQQEQQRIVSEDDEKLDHPKAPMAELSLNDQISRCFGFFVGVLSAHELNLQSLLLEFYSDTNEFSQGQRQATALDFRYVHGVTSVVDVTKLFPVLMFPCVWVHKVLQRRILGARTWQVLQKRRCELRLVGMNATFLTFTDIITASQVHVHHKKNRRQQQSDELWSKISSVWLRVRQTSARTKEPEERESLSHLAKVSTNSESRLSTPRKILPSIDGNAADKPRELGDASDLQELRVSNMDEAWKVTANNVIASVYVDMSLAKQLQNGTLHESHAERARELFQGTAREVYDGKLAPAAVEAVRRTLVRAFGYQFTKFLFEKSSLQEVSSASKSSPEQKRARQRYAKSWESLKIPEDKPSYWKQLFDPASKHAFYYNVRTGESRWEKPANFVSKKKLKKKMKVKAT